MSARKKKLGLIVLFLGVGACVLCLIWIQSSSVNPPTKNARSESFAGRQTQNSAVLDFGYQWPIGTVLDYSFKLNFASHVASPLQQSTLLDAQLQLAGELRLRVLKSAGHEHYVVFEIFKINQLKWVFAGIAGPSQQTDDKDFMQQAGLMILDHRGRIKDLRFPPGTARTYANVMETLLRQLQAPVESGQAHWTLDVDAGFGRAKSTYKLIACGEQSCSVNMQRQQGAYEQFSFVPASVTWDFAKSQAEQNFVIVRDGYLKSCETQEEINIYRHKQKTISTSLSAEISFIRKSWESPKRVSAKQQAWVQASQLPNQAMQNALNTRVAGMTLAQLRDDVLKYANGGKMPRHQSWLWQATGLLKQKPELAFALADLFCEPSLNGRAKSLVLDLLANVSTEQAQQVLREVLDDPETKERTDYPALVQRYLLVRDPDDAALDFLQANYQNHNDPADNRYASVVALGAALGRASNRDPQGTLLRAMALAQDLREAKDPITRKALVTALGSAGRVELLDDILRCTHDADPVVRSAAAEALRKITTPVATQRLLQLLVTEGHPAVQAASLRALALHKPSAMQLERLAQNMEAAALAPQNLRSFIQFLRVQARRLPQPVLLVAEALQRRGIPDRALSQDLQAFIVSLRLGAGQR